MVELLALAALDQFSDALGDCGFELKSVLQGNQSAGSLVAFSWCKRSKILSQNLQVLGILNQSGDVNVGNDGFALVQIATTHAQVLDKLVSVFALLAGGVEEEFGESWTVDGVLGEMGTHRQVFQRSGDFFLDLILCGSDATVGHINEVDSAENGAGNIFCACKMSKAKTKALMALKIVHRLRFSDF